MGLWVSSSMNLQTHLKYPSGFYYMGEQAVFIDFLLETPHLGGKIEGEKMGVAMERYRV